jgi:hypothetical protein
VSFRDLKKAERERDQMLAREKGKPDKIMDERIRRTQKQIEALRRANINPRRYYSDRYAWFDDLLVLVKKYVSGKIIPPIRSGFRR